MEFLIAPVYLDVAREDWYQTDRGQRKVLGELTSIPQSVPRRDEIEPYYKRKIQ